MCMALAVMQKPPLGKALWDAGFLLVFYTGVMQRYNPIERISKSNLVAAGISSALNMVFEGAQTEGVEVMQQLLDTGALDIAISGLNAYQMLGKPEEASVCSVSFGVLYLLEVLLRSPQARPIVTDKLRSAGVDSFRYLIDNPLVLWEVAGLETGVRATQIAARVRITLLLCLASLNVRT